MSNLLAYAIILKGVGPALRISGDSDQLFRYYVLETLNNEGLFKYLEEPHTYSEILAEFGYVDNEYTRELLNILVKDRQPVILEENGMFRRNPSVPLPELEKVIKNTSKRIHSFGLMAKGMTTYIPMRLRNEPIEFSSSFEADGRQLLVKFDATLGNRVYTAIRDAAFAMLSRQERQWLQGKRLLDVGCGSGRETAEIWMKMKGDIQITAIDPVPTLLELAQQNFVSHLNTIRPDHPPVTADNLPTFEVASAVDLPYEDNTFDAAFHSLVLHWTPDPRKAISEIVRVVKPGGIIFGSQGTKPALNPYFDIVIQTNENTHGFFWREEFLRWYAENGIKLEMATPVGAFRGVKPVTARANGRSSAH